MSAPTHKTATAKYLLTQLLSAIITPPDVFSQTLVAIPLLILYEVSILISARVMKQKEKDREEFFSDDEGKAETVTS